MRSLTFWITRLAALVLITTATLSAQSIQRIEREDDDDGRYDEPYRGGGGRIDRYLEAEVWTDQDDGDYYEGDPITIFFRTNRDAYVAIYSVDTRGRVNLLFPSEPGEDNFVSGGGTFRLPGVRDNYNLKVSGPEGKEHIQLIASRERFPIPTWYRNSGIVSDWNNTDEFMDDINDQHFVRYPGQRFAYDRAVIFVNEWEDYYYRPIYRPIYRDWDVCGNVYIDYPFGGAVYVNGIYWGCAPLYIPRIAVGWHTVSIYDRNGYCWENDFQVHHYRTVVLDRHVVRPQPGVRSKYKEVQIAGYVDPQRAGYKTVKQLPSTSSYGSSKSRNGESYSSGSVGSEPMKRKYLRGDGEVVKTSRGYEIANSSPSDPSPTKGRSNYGSSSDGSKNRGGSDYNTGSSGSGRSGSKVRVGSPESGSSGNSSSGSATEQGRDRKRVKVAPPAEPNSGGNESGKAKSGEKSGGSSSGTEPGGKVKSGTRENPPPQSTGTSNGSSGSNSSGKAKKPR